MKLVVFLSLRQRKRLDEGNGIYIYGIYRYIYIPIWIDKDLKWCLKNIFYNKIGDMIKMSPVE